MKELSEYGKLKEQEIDITDAKYWKPVYEEIQKIQRGESPKIEFITQEQEKKLKEEIKHLKKRIEALELKNEA